MQQPTHLFRLLSGACGIAGPVILVASFRINPAPPPGLGTAALAAWAAPRIGMIMVGGWMQGIGSLLIVIFSYALLEFAPETAPLAQRVTRLAGAIILMVSLTEVAFYIAAAEAVAAGDVARGLEAKGLIHAVQHVFLIAPAVLIPLSIYLYRSRVLPALFAATGFLVGMTLQVLGVVGLFGNYQPLVDIVLIVQAAWFVLAGLAMMVTKSAAAPAAAA